MGSGDGPSEARDAADEDDRPELTREFLVELYHDRGLSVGEISEGTGWSKAWVWQRLDACDIETRRRGRQTKFHDLDDELLQYLDWLTPTQQADLRGVAIEGRGIAEQARERGVEPISVWQSLDVAVERLEAIAAEQAEE